MSGWEGLPEVPVDGTSWPLSFAAKMLDIDEKDLRTLVRIAGMKPVGTIKTADFRRQGRNPRAYSASTLVALVQTVREAGVNLST